MIINIFKQRSLSTFGAIAIILKADEAVQHVCGIISCGTSTFDPPGCLTQMPAGFCYNYDPAKENSTFVII